jgi:phytoene/squalene synthetase
MVALTLSNALARRLNDLLALTTRIAGTGGELMSRIFAADDERLMTTV